MRRNSSAKVAKRNESILKKIRWLKADHPFWGYRRVWAYLKYIAKLNVNKKRILRLMREHDLLVKPNQRIRAKRAINTHKPRPTRPAQWWGIDMTKVMVSNFGWVYIVLVLDWFTKKIVGHYIGIQCKTEHWLDALNMAVQQEFPEGVRDNGLSLMSDNGCQPTSGRFMRDCSALQIHQAFTSYNNPKGNADTERMMRTLKEELIWLKEWDSPFELGKELDNWIRYYNNEYLHSSLGYKSPAQFENEFRNDRITLLVNA